MHYYMPPEWETHQRMFMQWPVLDDVWAENIDLARIAFADVARAISRFEPVTMLVNSDQYENAVALCGSSVNILLVPHDDSWARDTACTFVWDSQVSALAGIHWGFNAWGNKYPNFQLDGKVPTAICDHFCIREVDAQMILEGGSIHTNGHGTLLTTAECLLNKNRNPSMTASQITQRLCDLLGVRQVVFLERGLYLDETDGHIDNIACFLDENTVLMPKVVDPLDPNFAIVAKARETILQAGLTIAEVVHPPMTYEKGALLTLSYINFVFVNGGIILPKFGGDLEKYDDEARRTMQELFPTREIVSVYSRDIVRGGGNIHCITQQMPVDREPNIHI